MKFGPVSPIDSIGAISVHGLRRGAIVLKKGEIVSGAVATALAESGLETLVVARLEPGDVAEDQAARRLADAIAGQNVWIDQAFTGRANLFAARAGVFRVDVPAIDGINAQDESITVATLPAFRTVAAGEMVATVKIIPFAVPGRALDQVIAGLAVAPITVAPFNPLRVGVISTLLPGLKPSVIVKTLRVLEDRLRIAGARIADERRVPHEAEALATALRRQIEACDLLLVFGASAITDRRDVIPSALMEAGGRIEHFGMPVDPGNLLLLGSLGDVPVLGAPGCARSPKENGFDWILYRLLAGVPVRAADVRKLGAGGLLMEIVSRPQPRGGEKAVPDSDEVDFEGREA